VLKKHIFIIIIFLFFYIFSTCRKDITPIDNSLPKIILTIEDVGVTEVWLRLNTQNPSFKSQITISRNDSTIQQFNNPTHDTLIYDSVLLPNHDYTYTATLSTSTQKPVTSTQQLTTMDTTSHNFNWQSWAFGAKGSSILYDVAIIDNNNIWAVGEIYTEETYTYDSLGNWIDPYNAVHWDGNKWKLERLYFNFQGSNFWGPIYSIFSFNENNIWFGMGSLINWDGTNFYSVKIPDNIFPSTANKIWGTSNEDLYVVGNNGLIAYYNGQLWRRIESKINLPLNDIWGTIQNNEIFILCPASEIYQISDKKILKINDDLSVSELEFPFSDNRVHSIWFKDSSDVFICGASVFKRNRIGKYKKYNDLPNIFFRRIRGNDINDIMLTGDFGTLAHFNGQYWKQFTNLNEIDMFYSLDYKNQYAIAVGEDNSKAVIFKGTKLN